MAIILENMTREELRKLINESVKEIITEHLKEKPDQLLTRKETAAMLEVSLTTLKNWDNTGYLRPKRFGRRVFYFEKDVLERKPTGPPPRNKPRRNKASILVGA